MDKEKLGMTQQQPLKTYLDVAVERGKKSAVHLLQPLAHSCRNSRGWATAGWQGLAALLMPLCWETGQATAQVGCRTTTCALWSLTLGALA